MSLCVLHIAKESYKFSCAHMTVFPGGSKERLHGHNYQVRVDLTIDSLGLVSMQSFDTFKKIIKELCEAWDEFVLLPALCPYLEIIEDSPQHIHFRLCAKEYLLPRDEVILLQTDNIVVETLAQLFCEALTHKFHSVNLGVKKISLNVEETRGQGATFSWG